MHEQQQPNRPERGPWAAETVEKTRGFHIIGSTDRHSQWILPGARQVCFRVGGRAAADTGPTPLPSMLGAEQDDGIAPVRGRPAAAGVFFFGAAAASICALKCLSQLNDPLNRFDLRCAPDTGSFGKRLN